MKSKIIVDSSANVYQLPDVDFACVPLKILTDEQEYVDTEEVDAPALAQMMRTYKGRTSTSCPNISDWLTAYEGADEVYVVTITGTLSGAYNAALLAGEEYEQSHEGARVFVLDSLSAGPECRQLRQGQQKRGQHQRHGPAPTPPAAARKIQLHKHHPKAEYALQDGVRLWYNTERIQRM